MKNVPINTTSAEALRFGLPDDFLLYNQTAKSLYNVVKTLPVIDPHNHVDAAALAQNKHFENISQLWVQSDPYKHRAMRNLGVAESLITGAATDYDKFLAWAECLQQTVGNPLFHWSYMELKSLFGIDEVLMPENANAIWEKANGLLQKGGFGALDIVKRFGVETLCTSDDLLDSLEHHLLLAEAENNICCLPSLRSDSILAFSSPQFLPWTHKLQTLAQTEIASLASYKAALINRLNFFDGAGCLLSDHSLDSGFRFTTTDATVAEPLFEQVLQNGKLSEVENIQLQSHLLHFLGVEYAKRKWKMQLHIGANRYTSTRLRQAVGPAGGYASIGNSVDAHSLSTFLDGLEMEGCLPKTILYTLNPADNAVFATLTGSFTEDDVKGKVQFGPAWWLNDHHEGITQQLITLSNYGLLSASIGMTTDSRSVLSFSRHDYFRRILCNLIGTWAEEGKVPQDKEFLSMLVSNIAYYNIKNWIQK